MLEPQGRPSPAPSPAGREGFTTSASASAFELTVEGEVTDEVLAEARRIADEVLSTRDRGVVGVEVAE
ncbi:phosphoribosylformylglycinamidine synthase [Methylobacterium radiotolerans]|nr:phosphoribosylformylglycinamidine synthase [Methylobacterium radiotolerans]